MSAAAQAQALSLALDGMRQQRDKAVAERQQAAKEADQLRLGLQATQELLDARTAERQQAQDERDAALEQLENDAYQLALGRVRAESDKWKECFDSAREALDATSADLNTVNAERQQAIDERDAALHRNKELEQQHKTDVTRRNILHDMNRDLIEENEALKRRCKQAIDALRETNTKAKSLPYADEPYEVAGKIEQITAAALLSLGEQP